MNTRIRIAVRSTRTRSFGWSWVTADHHEDGRTEHARFGYAPTMPEAFAEAHAAALVIHRILMDEVHASRARRRVLAGQALDATVTGLCECGHLLVEHDTDARCTVSACPYVCTFDGLAAIPHAYVHAMEAPA